MLRRGYAICVQQAPGRLYKKRISALILWYSSFDLLYESEAYTRLCLVHVNTISISAGGITTNGLLRDRRHVLEPACSYARAA